MAGVSVKIRSTGRRDPERRGQLAVALLGLGVVVGVPHFEGGQPGRPPAGE